MSRYTVKSGALLSLLFIFVLVACSPKLHLLDSPILSENKDLDKFLFSFEKAVLAHDKQGCMSFMSPRYVHEQHDQFLEGRTDQFLREFFSGTVEAGIQVEGEEKVNNYRSINFNEIKNIELILITSNDALKEVVYRITTNKDMVISCTCFVEDIQEKDAKYPYGIFGAVG